MSSSMPILQRMDRLDRLLQFLEEKHCLSSKHSSSSSTTAACESSELAQDRESYKSLSSAIEEVHCKGTLIERVAMLESRVLQLSLEMDLENASSSSCSTFLVSDQKFEQDKQDPLTNGGKQVLSCTERTYVMILARVSIFKGMCEKAKGFEESWEKKNKKDKHCLHHSVKRMA